MADLHHLPAVWSDEPMHELTRDCWCVPVVDDSYPNLVHHKDCAARPNPATRDDRG